ncbi:MAG: YscO family type III secretion system apparatus protein [Candidatus Methylacidiphilales bacterium]|nr:YscO family type III secretion system apparatus protein [Candidatus Methylacidiphilales bacterium]
MKYPLQDLLRLRKLRENNASNAVTRARKAAREAEEALEAQKKALEDYRIYRVKEEDRLYEQIILKKIHLNDLDDVKQAIGWLRERELLEIKKVADAELAVVKAKEVLEKAQLVYQQAVRDSQKIEEHKTMALEEWQKEQERNADLELEEFTPRDPEAAMGEDD